MSPEIHGLTACCNPKHISDGIIRINNDISYTEFFVRYMVPNIPCIFHQDITKLWRSRKHWVIGNKPNFQFLQEQYGNLVAPVANCNENYYGSQKKCDMLVSEFLNYWKKFISNGYPSDMPILYLKDWHLKRDSPDSNFYQVPSYFASDWLNEFWSQRTDICDDYRFVYMGPKGSWTPEHVDVFSSYSWSANIVGKKRWIFYPPTEIESIQDIPSAPVYKKDVIEVIQEAGEVIFVPSGWRHEVYNLEDTISINHNWANACNVEKWIWPSLNSALSAVEAELQDCLEEGMDSWEEQCQVLLRATHGIDFAEFYSFLRALAEPRIHFLLRFDRFVTKDFVTYQGSCDKDKIFNDASVNKKVELEEECSSNVAKELNYEVLSLCYELMPLKVVHLLLCNDTSSQKLVELILENENGEFSTAKETVEEGVDAMCCENGWCLGMHHALYDLWCIQRVITTFFSHHCITKLEFFRKLKMSESHLRFMSNLEALICHAEACGMLKALYEICPITARG